MPISCFYDEHISMDGFDHDISLKNMSDEQLAHEMLIKEDYKLTEYDTYPSNAFWDDLVNGLILTPPCYRKAVHAFNMILKMLIDICPSRTHELMDITNELKAKTDNDSIYKFILKSIDMLMKETVSKPLSRDRWKDMHSSIMNRYCNDWIQLFVNVLRTCFETCKSMRADAENERIRQLKKTIGSDGILYERAKYRKHVLENECYIESTKEWIKRTIDQEMASDNTLIKRLKLGDSNAIEFVYAQAFLSLIAQDNNTFENGFPSILNLDIDRIRRYNLEFHYEVMGSILIAIISDRNRYTSDIEASNIKNHINTMKCCKANNEEFISQLLDFMDDNDRIRLLEAFHIEFLSDMARNMIYRQWQHMILGGTDVMDSIYVESIIDRLKRNMEEVMKIVEINKSVHWDRYIDILFEIIMRL